MGCEWCGGEGPWINHHWPVANKDGGKGTVSICTRCHANVHHGYLLLSVIDAKDEEEYEYMLMETKVRAIKQDFPQLWDQLVEGHSIGDQIEIPPVYDRIMYLNPPWMWGRKSSE